MFFEFVFMREMRVFRLNTSPTYLCHVCITSICAQILISYINSNVSNNVAFHPFYENILVSFQSNDVVAYIK